MSKLPRSLPGKEVVKALKKTGFYFKRQKGSHIILRRDVPFAQVVVPDHKSIERGHWIAYSTMLAFRPAILSNCSDNKHICG
jgi:predicted RNA binding protein YcfA (HicA-like mRNA interferase family)